MKALLLVLVVWHALAATDPSFPPPSDHGVVELTPAVWDTVIKNEKYDVVVEFYSPYCIYCQQLEPVWNELGDKFKNEDSVIISRIDYSKRENYIEGYHVRAVPTIMIFPSKSKANPVTFNNQRSLNNFIQWIVENSQQKIDVPIHHKSLPKPANNDGPLITVVGETWQEIVMNKEKDVFVNFFAPWCPFSQRLAPIWKELAEKMQPYSDLVIAEFDGTQNEVPGVHLHAFPTTTLYHKGNKAQSQFRGPTRSVEAYTEWLKATVPDAFNPHLELPDKIKDTDVKAILDKHQAFDDAHLVTEINEETFLSLTSGSSEKNIVVLFYAEWDEQKEEHKDLWDDIALDYQFVSSIEFFQMEASKAPQTGVTVFPSVKIFPCPKLTYGLHELKREAAWGQADAVAKLATLTEKASEWQRIRLSAMDPEARFTSQRHWRRLSSREKERVLTGSKRGQTPIPTDFDEFWKNPTAVPAVPFQGQDINIENIKEFIQVNSNPTKEDIVASLVRGIQAEQPAKRNSGGEQAYQTMIYKEDL